MNIPAVSVVVPVYNAETVLGRCLKSLHSQTCTSIEFIIIDDGSTDHSPVLCDKAGLDDERFRIVHVANEGVSEARNLGIKLSRGRYIGFVDADDWVEPDTFAYALTNAEQTDADISIFGYWDVRGNTSHNEKMFFPLKQISHEQAFQLINSFRAFDYQVWDKLYRRELFANLNFHDGLRDEDLRVTTILIERANNICYDSTPKYHYRHSMTGRSQSKEVCLDGPSFARQMLHLVERKYPGAIAYALFRYCVVCVWEYDRILYNQKYHVYSYFCNSFVTTLRKQNVVQKMKNIKSQAAVEPYIRKFSLLSFSPKFYSIYHTLTRRLNA